MSKEKSLSGVMRYFKNLREIKRERDKELKANRGEVIRKLKRMAGVKP